MKILSEKCYKNSPMYVSTGDIFHMTYTDENGKVTELDSVDITTPMIINKLSIIELRDELGFKVGIGGIFGEAL